MCLTRAMNESPSSPVSETQAPCSPPLFPGLLSSANWPPPILQKRKQKAWAPRPSVPSRASRGQGQFPAKGVWRERRRTNGSRESGFSPSCQSPGSPRRAPGEPFLPAPDPPAPDQTPRWTRSALPQPRTLSWTHLAVAHSPTPSSRVWSRHSGAPPPGPLTRGGAARGGVRAGACPRPLPSAPSLFLSGTPSSSSRFPRPFISLFSAE